MSDIIANILVGILLASVGGYLYHWRPEIGIAYIIYILWTPKRKKHA